MKTPQAIESLEALASESRLAIFRLLVRNAPHGLPAGSIARRLRMPAPTLSFHLSALFGAGLVYSRKNGRSISYSPNLALVHDLAAFLTEECCQGRGGCGPLDERRPAARHRRR